MPLPAYQYYRHCADCLSKRVYFGALIYQPPFFLIILILLQANKYALICCLVTVYIPVAAKAAKQELSLPKILAAFQCKKKRSSI
jgi:hypothetical protein